MRCFKHWIWIWANCWGSDTTERLYFHFSLSFIGEGNGNPLQCSCLENPRDRGAWWAAVYGVAQSWTRLKRLSSSSSTFSLVTLRPFKAKSFRKWILSSSEEAWEGEQRSKLFPYCSKVEPLGNFILSGSAFRICRKEEGLSAKSWGMTSQVNYFSSLVKAKKILGSFINWNTKECTV